MLEAVFLDGREGLGCHGGLGSLLNLLEKWTATKSVHDVCLEDDALVMVGLSTTVEDCEHRISNLSDGDELRVESVRVRK